MPPADDEAARLIHADRRVEALVGQLEASTALRRQAIAKETQEATAELQALKVQKMVLDKERGARIARSRLRKRRERERREATEEAAAAAKRADEPPAPTGALPEASPAASVDAPRQRKRAPWCYGLVATLILGIVAALLLVAAAAALVRRTAGHEMPT